MSAKLKMNLSLRKRIALLYLLATALLSGVLFVTVYLVVYNTVYRHLDSDLDAESMEIYHNLVVLNDRFIITNPDEWQEKEHRQIEVNPTFVQILDINGNIVRKTGNLLNGKLGFNPNIYTRTYFNTQLSGAPIRQVQFPVHNQTGKILGFIIIAIPLEESALVLTNLRNVLLVAFPLVLFLLYFITRMIAGKSIAPINKVTETAEKISRENISERIELPFHKDEIFTLTSTINGLLDRLQDAVLRERQFTADASHELRTPLAIIKGTLEVLIRKPRSIEQYQNKISYCINEVDRMSVIIDQLLLLARYESGKIKPQLQPRDLCSLLNETILRQQKSIKEKRLNVSYINELNCTINADNSMLHVIFDNIISNAVKYSDYGREIIIKTVIDNNSPVCIVTDFGIGMNKEQLSKIFDRFYRADESRNSRISGNGLGLAIVKRLADLQELKLRVESEPDKGTSFYVIFKNSHDCTPAELIK
ncbi:MAG: sensor histidine kinase [Bacillota bacterium]